MKLGFDVKFHWIRASHLTILLDKGEPAHVVAKRSGHDPVTLLRSYARWTKKADAKVAETLASLSKGMAWPKEVSRGVERSGSVLADLPPTY